MNIKRLNSFDLKMIAIITMVIDHVGYVFFPEYRIFRFVGRMAFPIFCFLIVEGYFHTSNIKRYLGRLLAFAFVSELPFDLVVNASGDYFNSQNIFFTLFLGLAAIACMGYVQKRYPVNYYVRTMFNIVIAFGFSFVALVLQTDYSVLGVFYIILFYLFRGNNVFLFLSIEIISIYFSGGVFVHGRLMSQTLAGLAVVITSCYNGERGPRMKYFFYLFYPAHLLIIAFVYYILYGTLPFM